MGSAMRRSTAQFLAAEAGVIALPPTEDNQCGPPPPKVYNNIWHWGEGVVLKLRGRLEWGRAMANRMLHEGIGLLIGPLLNGPC